MNNKITFPELVDMMASKASTTKRVAELFLKELFATVTQALTEGQNVKIKGIGTFKLIPVNARRSVDVNTGESIEIPKHKKLIFVPDKAMADAVNLPFAQFETEMLDEHVTNEQLAAIDTAASNQPASADAAPGRSTEEVPTAPARRETTEALDDLDNDEDNEDNEDNEDDEMMAAIQALMDVKPGDSPIPVATGDQQPAASELSENGEAGTEAEEVAAPQEQPPAFVAPASVDEKAESASEQPAAASQEQPASSTSENTPLEMSEFKVMSEKEKRKIAHRFFLEGFVIGVVTTLLVTLVSYRLWMMKASTQHDKAAPKLEQAASPTPPSTSSSQRRAQPATPPRGPAATAQQPATQPAPPAPPAEPNHAAAKPTAATKPVIDVIKPSTTLNKLGRKHYGKNVFWVYIYEENKDKIKNPNNIPLGTRLVIPPAEKYGIDKDDPASVAKAKKKQAELYQLAS